MKDRAVNKNILLGTSNLLSKLSELKIEEAKKSVVEIEQALNTNQLKPCRFKNDDSRCAAISRGNLIKSPSSYLKAIQLLYINEVEDKAAQKLINLAIRVTAILPAHLHEPLDVDDAMEFKKFRTSLELLLRQEFWLLEGLRTMYLDDYQKAMYETGMIQGSGKHQSIRSKSFSLWQKLTLKDKESFPSQCLEAAAFGVGGAFFGFFLFLMPLALIGLFPEEGFPSNFVTWTTLWGGAAGGMLFGKFVYEPKRPEIKNQTL